MHSTSSKIAVIGLGYVGLPLAIALAKQARLLPELRDRFDLPAVTPVADDAERLRFYEGVAALLEAVAFEQPVLVVLEGLESSGERTQELLHFLATRLGDAAVLLLLATCPGPADGRRLRV